MSSVNIRGYTRKDNIPATVFKREHPALYKQIMEEYAPIFDKITAIELYQAGLLAKELGYDILRISDTNLNFDLINLSNVEIELHNSILLEERSKNLKNRKPRRKYVNNIE